MSRTDLPESVRQRVRTATGQRCGYCLSPQRYVLGQLEIEHRIPRAQGGSDDELNLWLSCSLCNRHKGAQVTAPDPLDGTNVPLFNPRANNWDEHFSWSPDGAFISGRTAIGRATVAALKLNNEIAVEVRRNWILAGWHPPVASEDWRAMRNEYQVNKRNVGPVLMAVSLLCVCVSALVLGQGGDPRKRNTNSTTTPPRKKAVAKKAPVRPTTRSTPRPATPRQSPQIEMVLIPGGTFTMGSPDDEVDRGSDEGPQRQVSVQSFYIGKYEVTQAQYRAVMGTNPSRFKGDNLPVEDVPWKDAVKFCRRLSQLAGKVYRLPSEAEWEYACRAGTETPFAFGSSLSSEQANFDGNYPYGGAPKGVSREKTTPVGMFQPNAFGLYDMHGNVWEWCQDWYHDDYNGAPTDGSAWLARGELSWRLGILRGGSWTNGALQLRSARRHGFEPLDPDDSLGFRVVAVR